ncbi:hypothetical protein JCGZ_20406 [Jatropha curcas]|uniref:Uncharacterized protein n=1 Tax=Jatropha curcas TaxID=180498 RepID=A0A067JZ39_JATCU|nr:hypothetical protein JCGZ_20406 [Jatropha curcas]
MLAPGNQRKRSLTQKHAFLGTANTKALTGFRTVGNAINPGSTILIWLITRDSCPENLDVKPGKHMTENQLCG